MKAAYSIIWARRFVGPINYLPNDQAVVDIFNAIYLLCPILMLMLVLKQGLKAILGTNSRFGCLSGDTLVDLGAFSHSLML